MIKKVWAFLSRRGIQIIWKPLYYIMLVNQLREWMLGLKVYRAGKRVTFRPEFDVFGNGRVFIGNNVQLFDLFINCNFAEIHIGDYAFFGHRVMLISGYHDYNKFGLERQTTVGGKDIHIGEGAWIGSGSIILGGVRIGDHAVISAGSVVMSNVPDFGIAGGVPARFLKMIAPPLHEKE
jgi:acetyltransferase-like isoleucine patch superfamily enzyme